MTRIEILERLQNGKITVEEATKLLDKCSSNNTYNIDLWDSPIKRFKDW